MDEDDRRHTAIVLEQQRKMRDHHHHHHHHHRRLKNHHDRDRNDHRLLRTITASTTSSSCDPGPNKTILTIGQDFFSIEEYILSQYNASLHRATKQQSFSSSGSSSITPTPTLHSFHPAASMVYTDIQTLRGVDAPIDYGSGVQYAQGLAEAFPDAGLQIGLWLNGTAGCRDIVETTVLDENIRKLYASIARWKLPKVFLRVGYEFDNPYFGYSEDPSYYPKAFRIMVDACETQLGYETCHSTVAFCWHSWAAPRWVSSLDEFYPGDDVVDWVGISIFQQLYPWANGDDNDNGAGNDFAGGSMSYVKEVLEYARRHEKPVMIAESTPFGGVFWNGTDFGEGSVSPPPPYNTNNTTGAPSPRPDNIWSLWFAPILQLIEDYDIRMWSYIDCDWNSQPMWHNIGFGETRLAAAPSLSSSTDNATVMTHWWEQVLQNPRFVAAPLQCGNEKSPTPASALSRWSSATLVPPAPFWAGWKPHEENAAGLLPKLAVLTLFLGITFVTRYKRRRNSSIRALQMIRRSNSTGQLLSEESGYGSIPQRY